MIRRSHTALVERNVEWSGAFTTEPYEAGRGLGGALLREGAQARRAESERVGYGAGLAGWDGLV